MKSLAKRQSRWALLSEALLVAGVGLTFALTANRLSPKGLVLSRDYFPSAAPARPAAAAAEGHDGAARDAGRGGPASPGATAAGETGAPEPFAARAQAAVQAEGFLHLEFADALALFEDPRRALEQVVFIDARDDAHFRRGHIPGAYSFDRFYPERYVPVVLPVALAAEQVVVYCEGGACEDSLFAARFLRDEGGIPAEQIAVYTGGIADWTRQGGPVETGERLSGNLPASAGADAAAPVPEAPR